MNPSDSRLASELTNRGPLNYSFVGPRKRSADPYGRSIFSTRSREIPLRGYFFWSFEVKRAPWRGDQTRMEVREGERSGNKMKRAHDGVTVATITRPIATMGEIFPDRSTIELIGGAYDSHPALMLWDGSKEIVGARIEHRGQFYEPATFNSSILHELTLPTLCSPHATTREFLAETCKLITNFVGLEEKLESLVGRIVLCSALVDAVSVAPTLVIGGPDTTRGNRLVALLRCLCRHSLLLTGVTPAGFCSLPSGGRFTYLIDQSTISEKLQKLLHDASSRDRKIPVHGRLLDLFGTQVIHSDSIPGSDSRRLRSIQISLVPTGRELPVFDSDTQHRITTEFQAKLLSFRRANLGAARKLQFDASQFTFALRDCARSIAAATPDDADLQAEVFELLREHDAEIRSERWTSLSSVAIEAVLIAGRESPGGVNYVADLAEIAQEILRRRGEAKPEITAGVLGKRLKLLGFTTEPRDARGKKLLLTEAVLNYARQLARDFCGPECDGGGSMNTSEQA